KPEIVLDARRGLRLATRRLALDDDGAQPFRRAVDRRGQPRRAAADDHRVVLARARTGLEPELLRDHPRGRAHVAGAVLAAHSAGGRRRLRAPLAGEVRSVRGEPLEADLVAGEETAQGVAVDVPLVADDQRARLRRFGREPLQASHALAGERAHLLGY